MIGWLRENGLEGIGRFYASYRGLVVDNKDPLSLNRLKVEVPGVTQTLVWAFPKNQAGNLGSGFKYLTPVPGDIVFVSFQSGDPNYPLWEYCGWANTQCPKELENLTTIGIVTPSGNKILLDDETNEAKILIRVGEKDFHEVLITPKVIKVTTPTEIKIETKSSIDTKSETTIDISSKEDQNIRGKNIIFNDGSVGTTMTDNLVDRLNILEKDLNNLKAALANAAGLAIPQDGGKAAFLSLTGYSNSKLKETQMSDIEHKTVKQ